MIGNHGEPVHNASFFTKHREWAGMSFNLAADHPDRERPWPRRTPRPAGSAGDDDHATASSTELVRPVLRGRAAGRRAEPRPGGGAPAAEHPALPDRLLRRAQGRASSCCRLNPLLMAPEIEYHLTDSAAALLVGIRGACTPRRPRPARSPGSRSTWSA